MFSPDSTQPKPTEWIPPSEEIQRLFRFEQTPIQEVSSKSTGVIDEYSFSEEEFAKMPSTLMKAVRRVDELLVQTEAARRVAIEANNELKGVQSLIVRHAKKIIKDAEKNEVIAESNSDNGKTRGFRRQCRISDSMCQFMGLSPGSTPSRVEVNHAINNHIKTHNLIDKENAQLILPDDKLWGILSDNARGNKITYFSIQKYIKHHFLKN
jgi:chromatin remodeling complex protein RSC6